MGEKLQRRTAPRCAGKPAPAVFSERVLQGKPLLLDCQLDGGAYALSADTIPISVNQEDMR